MWSRIHTYFICLLNLYFENWNLYKLICMNLYGEVIIIFEFSLVFVRCCFINLVISILNYRHFNKIMIKTEKKELYIFRLKI